MSESESRLSLQCALCGEIIRADEPNVPFPRYEMVLCRGDGDAAYKEHERASGRIFDAWKAKIRAHICPGRQKP